MGEFWCLVFGAFCRSLDCSATTSSPPLAWNSVRLYDPGSRVYEMPSAGLSIGAGQYGGRDQRIDDPLAVRPGAEACLGISGAALTS
jgi:hypothetical protein